MRNEVDMRVVLTFQVQRQILANVAGVGVSRQRD